MFSLVKLISWPALAILVITAGCTDDGGPQANLCGNGRLDPGETCDTRDPATQAGCSPTCQRALSTTRPPNCGNGTVERNQGEQCEPNDPATRVQPGTNLPCNANFCDYRPNTGTPGPGPGGPLPPQGASLCPQPLQALTCNSRHEFSTAIDPRMPNPFVQQRLNYYNQTCGGNTNGPETAYTFILPPPPPGSPLQARAVNVWINDGNGNEDLDVYVIAPDAGAGGAGTCSPQNCIAWGERYSQFLALPGIQYTFVVDGRRARAYTIEVGCATGVGSSCQSTQFGTFCN